MNNDRMRVSDADREQVTTRLREHFAEGRLSSDELDERVSAALGAKTVGDLRHVLADLPEPEPAGVSASASVRRGPSRAHTGRRPVYVHRRGPRIFPLALIVLLAALILPGAGFLFVTFLKVILVIWLVTCLAGVFAAARFRRHLRHWQSSYRDQWQSGFRGHWHQWE